MKKAIIYLTLFIFIVFTVCCTGKKAAGGQIAEADSLKVVMAQQDSTLTDVFESLNVIMENLHDIKARENIIAAAVADDMTFSSSMNKINSDIDAIDSLLIANRQVVDDLQKNIRGMQNASMYVSSLEKLVEEISIQLNANDMEIVSLRRELAEKSVQVKNLSSEVIGLTHRGEVLEDEVRATSDLLNIAYYISDSQKELLRHNIIYKTGFVGRTLRVNENRSLDSFIKIDIRSFDHIQIDGSSPMLVSVHAADSYKFATDKQGVTWLNITDKNNFWKHTKVLVISYK